MSSAGFGNETVGRPAYRRKILLPPRRNPYRGSRAGSFIRVKMPERLLIIQKKKKNQELHHEEDRRGRSSKTVVTIFCGNQWQNTDGKTSGINKVLDICLSTWRKTKKQKLEGVLSPLFPTVNSLRPVCGQKLDKVERL